MDGKSAIRGETLPKLVSISKVLEGILVICPALISKKMCGKMWLKQRKARPRKLYTISSRYANFCVQHDSYKFRKPLLTCFGKVFSAMRNCTSEKLFSHFYYLLLGKTFKVHTNNTTGNSVGSLVLNNSQADIVH